MYVVECSPCMGFLVCHRGIVMVPNGWYIVRLYVGNALGRTGRLVVVMIRYVFM